MGAIFKRTKLHYPMSGRNVSLIQTKRPKLHFPAKLQNVPLTIEVNPPEVNPAETSGGTFEEHSGQHVPVDKTRIRGPILLSPHLGNGNKIRIREPFLLERPGNVNKTRVSGPFLLERPKLEVNPGKFP